MHEIGLEQLALLDDEYRIIGPAALGIDDPAQLRERLRSDSSLRYSTAAEIIADAMATSAVPKPKLHAGSRASRAHAAGRRRRRRPARVLHRALPDGARGGTFFFKTAVPSAWTRFQLEATTFHEAIPGHHLQLALAQELDLHPVVGQLEVTSYGEGWGLYAERLADEMSLYSSRSNASAC